MLAPIAWYCANAGNNTHRGGELSPNDWGLYDMIANAGEWAGSLVLLGPTSREWWYGQGPHVDWQPTFEVRGQTGPDRTVQFAHQRGSLAFVWPHVMRAANYNALPPGIPTYAVGFRLAQTIFR